MREFELTLPLNATANSNIRDILWNKLSNFHDVSWLFGTNAVLNKTGGDPLSVGATRTYQTGGTETVIKRNDQTKFLKWDLTTYQDYEASFQISPNQINFQIQGRIPKAKLDEAEAGGRARLSLCIQECKGPNNATSTSN